MKHPRWFNNQMFNDVYNHTQLTLSRMFIVWQPVSTSSICHHQATVQEEEHIQKVSAMR